MQIFKKNIPLKKKYSTKMVKKCIYCGNGVSEESVVDFCKTCGEKVWGEKMFNTIIQNMEEARDKGDLCLEHEISDYQKLEF